MAEQAFFIAILSSAVIAGTAGDRGAGEYLAQNGAERVECGDLWHGADVDRPDVAR